MACRFLSSIESSPLFFHSRPRRREKRWEQYFIFRISWKFKPQGLSQTARSNGGTTRRAQEIFPSTRAVSPVMHRRIFTEGRPHLFPQSRWEWETQKFPPRKKVGAVFYIPDYMETQAPWTFPNCPERWRDNSESAEDFSPDKGRLSRYAPAYFHRGAAPSVPQSRMEWEYKTPTSIAKGGSSVYESRTNR